MFTIAVIMLPLCLITMVIEFLMDIPRMIRERKEFAMFRKERSIWLKGC